MNQNQFWLSTRSKMNSDAVDLISNTVTYEGGLTLANKSYVTRGYVFNEPPFTNVPQTTSEIRSNLGHQMATLLPGSADMGWDVAAPGDGDLPRDSVAFRCFRVSKHINCTGFQMPSLTQFNSNKYHDDVAAGEPVPDDPNVAVSTAFGLRDYRPDHPLFPKPHMFYPETQTDFSSAALSKRYTA